MEKLQAVVDSVEEGVVLSKEDNQKNIVNQNYLI